MRGRESGIWRFKLRFWRRIRGRRERKSFCVASGWGGELPDRSARDAGKVPLSSRAPAKDGTQVPQTRCAQTVRYLCSNAVTRALRGSQIPGSRHSSPEAHRWDVAEIALARGASLRDAADVCSSRGCGKIYDSHLTCMGKPCIMIDKELLLFQYYILVKLINICYTHKEKRQWQKLEL